jgi:hypothetical protein
MKTRCVTLCLLTLSFVSTLQAEERPVKDLEDIARFILGEWSSAAPLEEDIAGLATKGTIVHYRDKGVYTHEKQFLRGTAWATHGDKTLEVSHVYFGPDPVTDNVRFWLFDLVGGFLVSGKAYVDGNTFFLRGEGKFLPKGEEDQKRFGTGIVPWQSEMMVTVIDADNATWKLNYVKIQGKPYPFPGVGVEVVAKRVK